MSETTTTASVWTITAQAYRPQPWGGFDGMFPPFTLDIMVPAPAHVRHTQWVEALALDALRAMNPRGKWSYTVAPAA